ncbi:unnamed protein product [Durusdinium trenchii]
MKSKNPSLLLGDAEGLGRRHRFALRCLMCPAARLVHLDPGTEEAQELRRLIVQEGFDSMDLARGLESGSGTPESESERALPAIGAQDMVDVRSNLTSLLRRSDASDGRPLAREELDDQMRNMGRRKVKRPGMVLQTFYMASRLSEDGVAALRLKGGSGEEDPTRREQVFTRSTQHLAPDTDSCAAAIEGLFACGAQDAAELIYRKCRAAFLPNPALYAAVIFGRLGCGDGQGATDAMLDMHAAGFTPHQRFISRCLRYMGPFHQHGLLLVERLGLPTMWQRLLHILIESCHMAADPASAALEVYRFLCEKQLAPDWETTFAMLKALCGLPTVKEAIQELERYADQEVLPRHCGFEMLLRECFGLANSRHRALLIMDSRRSWVEEVAATVSFGSYELTHMTAMGRELRRHVEEDEGYHEQADSLERLVLKLESGEVALKDECFGSSCTFRWVLNTYCAALPLHLAAIHSAQYVLWRYGLVRSGKQKELLQEELDQALAAKHSDIAMDLHRRLGVNCSCSQLYGPLPALEGPFEPLSFVLLLVMCFDHLEVVEGTHLRLMRMLFRALPNGSRTLAPKHVDFIEREAYRLAPAVLTELISMCEVKVEVDVSIGSRPFSTEDGRSRLAEIVENHYLKRVPGEEPTKLSHTLRFVRTHHLADRLEEEVLFLPVIGALNDGQPQHAYNLGEGDHLLQLRMVSFAIRKGFRLVAGRLVDRFGSKVLSALDAEVPGWSCEFGCFQEECEACVQEAEEAEEKEIRAVSDRKIAAVEEDANSLQLPPEVAEQIFFVSNKSELQEVEDRLSEMLRLNSEGDAFTLLAQPGHAVGLDVEWRPFLEKRSGMQKHRRSTASMEPCSTLQLAADRYVIVFDLLSLAPAGTPCAKQLSNLLTNVFSHAGILKLGFGLPHDLQRLAASYPHLECFRCLKGAVDVQEAFMTLRREKGQATGLSALCLEHFGSPLSKRLQTSDWGARPLSRDQLLYAALDAFCLLGLARKLPAEVLQVQKLQVGSVGGKLQVTQVTSTADAKADGEELAQLDADISCKGAEIRNMKAAKVAKAEWQAEVQVLLQLKAQYRELAGVDWVPIKEPVPA